MKTATMGSRGFGRFVVALGALSLGLLVTGCDPECVDRYDCANKKGSPGEGKLYVCESNRCVLRDVSDAGTEVDAGTDTDAGTDAGVSCTDLPHDPKLGTLQLQTGYAAAESATLPGGISNVTAIQSGADFKLYGLHDADKSLYTLGTWPNVSLGSAPLQSVIAEADRGVTTFLSGFLTNDGTRVLAGYTKPGPFTDIPGTVLVYDTASPDNSTYVSANGNLSAVGLSNAFLINGQGLEGVSEGGNAIYALKTGTSPFQGSKLATFPIANAFSSSVAVASNSVAVLGYSDPDQGYANTLRAVAPATYTPALTGGTTLALSDANAPAIYSGTDLFSVAGFGDGVVLHRGSYDPNTYAPLTHDVSRIELTPSGTDATSVTAGALAPVLTTQNTCTNVVLMSPLGPDLLVGVQDKNGSRLVRLQKQ